MSDPNLGSELSWFWDELVEGRSASPGGIDPALVNVIRQAHQESGELNPDPIYAKRLREELMNHSVASSGISGDSLPLTAASSNGFAPHSPVIRPVIRQWSMGYLAVAVVLLIAFGIGYVGYELGQSDIEDRKSIPAAIPPATPTPEDGDETLLEVTIPGTALPIGKYIDAGLAHFTIPVGNRSTWVSNCCPGPMIEYVVAGTYTVTAEAAIQVIRANGSVEEIAAGTEVTLGPGDGLVSRNETTVEGANTGSGPVELLNWVLLESGGFNGHILPGWVDHDAHVRGTFDVLPALMTVVLRRVTVPADAIYPAAVGVTQFAVQLPQLVDGTPVAPYLGRRTDGTLDNIGGPETTVYILTTKQEVPDSASSIASSPTP